MGSAGERIRVSTTRKTKTRWGLNAVWALLGQYPDEPDEERATVHVEDTVLGESWTIPVRSPERGRYVHDLIREAASTLSEDEVDEWSRAGRWPTLADVD